MHELVVERFDGQQIGEGEHVAEHGGPQDRLVQHDCGGPEPGVEPCGNVCQQAATVQLPMPVRLVDGAEWGGEPTAEHGDLLGQFCERPGQDAAGRRCSRAP
ncbi:hypothetical protein OG588_37595 [Streptomyces prunicolor]|uniref:hypothetical protein n=1 Tax=Streptomyces prunicolor TaxID=67348 RepID=UPI0038667E78|nr:hypothetical protein OG588_37595 [Streptomyces prunicolor]